MLHQVDFNPMNNQYSLVYSFNKLAYDIYKRVKMKIFKKLSPVLEKLQISEPETNKVVTRDVFATKVLDSRGDGAVLEIGPLNRPLINGEFMRYFDILSTSELRSRAASEGLDSNSVPEIH